MLFGQQAHFFDTFAFKKRWNFALRITSKDKLQLNEPPTHCIVNKFCASNNLISLQAKVDNFLTAINKYLIGIQNKKTAVVFGRNSQI